MNLLFIIPVILIIAGVVFMIIMNKKHKTAKSEIDLDIERTQYDRYKQELVTDGLKNVALSTIGVKLRRIETDCFWVLSGNDLHFFSTDTVGELDEHIIFDNFRIEKAMLQYGGILKSQLGVYSKLSEEYLPKTHVITFDIDGSSLSLEIHDRLNYRIDPQDLLNLKVQLETRAKYQVVGEKFIEILQDKFPNLNMS